MWRNRKCTLLSGRSQGGEAHSAQFQVYGGLGMAGARWLPGLGGRRGGEVFGAVKLLCMTEEWGLHNIVYFSEPVEHTARQMDPTVTRSSVSAHCVTSMLH